MGLSEVETAVSKRDRSFRTKKRFDKMIRLKESLIRLDRSVGMGRDLIIFPRIISIKGIFDASIFFLEGETARSVAFTWRWIPGGWDKAQANYYSLSEVWYGIVGCRGSGWIAE
jgi:hypothetical protein